MNQIPHDMLVIAVLCIEEYINPKIAFSFLKTMCA